MCIKVIKSITTDLVPNLHARIGCEFKVDLYGKVSCKSTLFKKIITGCGTYSTVYSAITNLLSRGRQVCEVSGYYVLGLLRHKAADGDVDLVTTIESLQDSCSCSTNSGVTGSIFLLDRSRSKQGAPVRV